MQQTFFIWQLKLDKAPQRLARWRVDLWHSVSPVAVEIAVIQWRVENQICGFVQRLRAVRVKLQSVTVASGVEYPVRASQAVHV